MDCIEIEMVVEVSLIKEAMKDRCGFVTGISPNHWIPGKDYAFLGKLKFIDIETLKPGATCKANGSFLVPRQDVHLFKKGFTWHICETYKIVGYAKVV